MKKIPFSPAEDQEAAVSILNSCILFCDVIVAGKETAAALKYDDENMFAPMIVMLEKDASADTLVRAAGDLGVPVVKNIMLAKNLTSYGKAGEPIPEASYRDVSLAFARLGSKKLRRPRKIRKSSYGIPVKTPRSLSIEMGASLFALTGEEPGREMLLAQPLNAMRKRLMRLLGFSIPLFRISGSSKLRNDEYRILFKGLEAGRGRLELGWYAVSSAISNTVSNGSGSAEFSTGCLPDIMNKPENIRAAAKVVASVIVRQADEIIQRRAPELLGRDEVEAIDRKSVV
jgi:flagellar biosynthesis component FlhA